MPAILSLNPCSVYGINKLLPLKGFPTGRSAVTTASNDFAKAIITNKSEVKEFYIIEENGFFKPHPKAQVKITTNKAPNENY